MCNQCDDITPLSSLDSEGHVLKEGDSVKVIHIPEWVYGGLRPDSVAAIRSCEGDVMTIDEIDDHGYVWVQRIVEQDNGSKRAHSFSNEPENFLKVLNN